MLDKTHAIDIARKLRAQIKKKDNNHDIALIFYDNRLIAKFGIRRSSKKSIGHDHIPKELRVSPHVCLGLARCTVTFEQWVQRMKELGLIVE